MPAVEAPNATLIAGSIFVPTITPTFSLSSVSFSTIAPTKLGVAIPTSAPGGDPTRGDQLFHDGPGCLTCHDTTDNIRIVGPSLMGVASRAASREPGKAADYYLHESIMDPNAFVVPGFPANTMPQSFSKTLSPQQIDDLVAYLETLK